MAIFLIIGSISVESIDKSDKYLDAKLNIPSITITDKTIEKSINDKIKNDIMNVYYEFRQEATNYKSENQFTLNNDFEVNKNNENLLSITIKYYKNATGAHGDYENISYNIDMKNGQNIHLYELFEKDSDYKKIIDLNIKNQIEKSDSEIYTFNGIKDNQKFYIKDDNLVIYFDLYDIAPYPKGIPEFPINIKDLNDIIKNEYIDIFK
jgi:hypothetical protein